MNGRKPCPKAVVCGPFALRCILHEGHRDEDCITDEIEEEQL